FRDMFAGLPSAIESSLQRDVKPAARPAWTRSAARFCAPRAGTGSTPRSPRGWSTSLLLALLVGGDLVGAPLDQIHALRAACCPIARRTCSASRVGCPQFGVATVAACVAAPRFSPRG